METTTTPAPQDWGYARCEECGRAFDLLDADAANEWHYGHDCDPSLPATPRIKPGTLVALEARKLNGRCVLVLGDDYLNRATVDTTIADAGWQLAEFSHTGLRVFVRVTDEYKKLGRYTVRKVEVRDVKTVTEWVPEHLRATLGDYSICAGLGTPRPTGWTHLDNVEVA